MAAQWSLSHSCYNMPLSIAKALLTNAIELAKLLSFSATLSSCRCGWKKCMDKLMIGIMYLIHFSSYH